MKLATMKLKRSQNNYDMEVELMQSLAKWEAGNGGRPLNTPPPPPPRPLRPLHSQRQRPLFRGLSRRERSQRLHVVRVPAASLHYTRCIQTSEQVHAAAN
jgi:hypothetical protein